MKHTQFLRVLFALVIVGIFTSTVSAHYRPALGRWVERDPIGYIESHNTYQFTTSRPHLLDPTGLKTEVYVYCRPGRSDKSGEGDDPFNSGRALPLNHCALIICCIKESAPTVCLKIELTGAEPGEIPTKREPQTFNPIRLKRKPEGGERFYDVCRRIRDADGNDREEPIGGGDDDCSLYEQIRQAMQDDEVPPYDALNGPNSNTYVRRLLDAVGLKICTYTECVKVPGRDVPIERERDTPHGAPGWDWVSASMPSNQSSCRWPVGMCRQPSPQEVNH